MTINTSPLKSLIGPFWQEISSLWSGVDFAFSDPSSDSVEQDEPALFASRAPAEPRSGINQGRYERCW
jgi:hypothetical protein